MSFRVAVTPSSSVPIYKQVVDQIRAAVARGDLHPGDALPSVRGLAEELVVNFNTVAKAYGELVRSGDIVSEAGRGVFVSPRPPQVSELERRRRLQSAVEQLVAEAVHVGADREDVHVAVDTHCDKTGVLPRRTRSRSEGRSRG